MSSTKNPNVHTLIELAYNQNADEVLKTYDRVAAEIDTASDYGDEDAAYVKISQLEKFSAALSFIVDAYPAEAQETIAAGLREKTKAFCVAGDFAKIVFFYNTLRKDYKRDL